MASSVASYINFRSYGTSGHLTRLADGSFMTVWTEFSMKGDAYVYGKLFKADGSTLRDVFLIDHATAIAEASYSEVTSTTLSDGRAVVAWVRSYGAGRSIVGKVVEPNGTPSSELILLSEGVNSTELPQLNALANGGFSVVYRGSYVDQNNQVFTGVIEHSLIEAANGQWDTQIHTPLHDLLNDSSNETIILGDGTYVAVVAAAEGNGSLIQAYVLGSDGEWNPFDIGSAPSGVNPTISPIGNDRFVAA